MAPHADRDVQIEGVTDTSAVVIPDPILTTANSHPMFTIDDVLPHRQKAAPMPPGVAAFASADMFKSKGVFYKPKSKRWDHRISIESRSRQPSSLKGAMKYLRPDVISLCGGLPSSDYFPFESVSFTMPSVPDFSEAQTRETGQTLSSSKHDVREGKSLFDLSIALNYGQSMGPPQLVRFLTEHTEIIHNPPYSDWDICMTAGATSSLDMALRALCNRGDYVITEEYSFSSAIETMRPMGLHPLGIKMDEHGMLASDLDHVLSTWDPSLRNGAPKPFVVYTVPSGQNPTAATQPTSRRHAIYSIAEKHDLILLEDEPYYFLQMEPFVSGVTHTIPHPFQPQPIADFVSKLTPSFLSLDTSGRVLRLDSFSKIIAPGARCGWVTGSTQLVERIIRNNEVSAQNPSGFTEMALYKLLEENWSHRGFLEWLQFIRAEYTRRRDVICNACEEYLPKEVVSWSPPMAGMFHWIGVDHTKHPEYREEGFSHDRLLELEEKVFLAGVERGVLMARGSWFRAEKGSDEKLFLRTTFAAASEEKIVEAIKRMGEALRGEFGLVQEEKKELMNGHAK